MSLVLVTGAAGRIGTMLRGGLPERGWALRCLDVVCLRIGTSAEEPTTTRHLATWLSPDDTVSLVHAALSAPSPGFAVVWGVSANTRNWWDLTSARALGYEPKDDAEVYAEALIEVHGEPDLTDPVHARVGGEYTTDAFDAENFQA